MQLLNSAALTLNSVGPTAKYNDVCSLWKDFSPTIYFDGTFGGATVVVECSPDPVSTLDASSRWHTITSQSAPAMISYNYKFKKIRARVATAGTGTCIVEIP